MTPHPPPPEGDETIRDSPFVTATKKELARLHAIEDAAKACDRIYSGSFQGLPIFCNFIDGEPVDAAPLFNALHAALEAKP